MADFVQKSLIKSSVRKLAAPIADLTSFVTLVQNILDTNPWGCTDYTSSGATVDGVTRTSQSYSGKVVYEDALAKTVGTISVKAPTAAAFNTDISTIMGTAALGTAMGGSPSHDSSEDAFSATLKCHDANGELYNVSFRRDSVTVSSYEADAIVTGIETWADTIPALA